MNFCGSIWQSPNKAGGCATIIFLLALYLPIQAAPQSLADQALIAQIDGAVEHRESGLSGYTVEEHYTITNSHFNDPATAVVKVTYKKDSGKQYEVVSRTGPSLLASKLLDSMLAEEQKLSVNPDRGLSVISSTNYGMVPAGEEQVGDRPCEVIAITPKQKSPYVLSGRIWVDARSKILVRIEGTAPQSPSFFAGKPNVVRDYGEMAGFGLALHSHAVSSGMLVGKTVVDIEYVHYQIDP